MQRTRLYISLFAIVVLALCSACGNGRGNGKKTTSASTATVAHEDCVPIFAESEGGEDGAVSAEQNEVAAIEAYLIADRCAGPFRIDTVIPEKLEGFNVRKSQEERILTNGETLVHRNTHH